MVFGAEAVVAASALAVVMHTVQEVSGDGGPIWKYLGLTTNRIIGVILLVGFGFVQAVAAHEAYIGRGVVAAVALAAFKLGDCVVSHWIPAIRGRLPNPGMSTTPLYAVEGVAVLAWVATRA